MKVLQELNVFLDSQCIVSQLDFQHKILNWSALLPLLSLHASKGREEWAGTTKIVSKFRSRQLEILNEKHLEISRKGTAVESYFSTVTDMVFFLKQDSNTAVLVKTSRNFQNRCFSFNISKCLLLNLETIFVVPAHSSLPLLECRDKRGRRVDQFKILC